MSIDYTPPQGSFLDVVANAHPNQDVCCGNRVAKASGIARDVRQMVEEIERLTAENAALLALTTALESRVTTLQNWTCVECGHS